MRRRRSPSRKRTAGDWLRNSNSIWRFGDVFSVFNIFPPLPTYFSLISFSLVYHIFHLWSVPKHLSQCVHKQLLPLLPSLDKTMGQSEILVHAATRQVDGTSLPSGRAGTAADEELQRHVHHHLQYQSSTAAATTPWVISCPSTSPSSPTYYLHP